MYKNKRILGLIPARGGSKGLPGKNIKKLIDKPLIAWSIEAGKRSKYIDRLIVSTDSDEIAEVAKNYKADVPFMRPRSLASDTSSSMDVVLHAMEEMDQQNDHFDFLVLLEPTSPLRNAEDIDKAISLLLDNRNAESIVGIAKVESAHPDFLCTIEKGFLGSYDSEKGFRVKRRQELNDLYYFEGTVYISSYSALRERKSFYHDRTLGYIVPKWKAFEVDDMSDFIIIEALARARQMGLLK